MSNTGIIHYGMVPQKIKGSYSLINYYIVHVANSVDGLCFFCLALQAKRKCLYSMYIELAEISLLAAFIRDIHSPMVLNVTGFAKIIFLGTQTKTYYHTVYQNMMAQCIN